METSDESTFISWGLRSSAIKRFVKYYTYYKTRQLYLSTIQFTIWITYQHCLSFRFTINIEDHSKIGQIPMTWIPDKSVIQILVVFSCCCSQNRERYVPTKWNMQQQIYPPPQTLLTCHFIPSSFFNILEGKKLNSIIISLLSFKLLILHSNFCMCVSWISLKKIMCIRLFL